MYVYANLVIDFCKKEINSISGWVFYEWSQYSQNRKSAQNMQISNGCSTRKEKVSTV